MFAAGASSRTGGLVTDSSCYIRCSCYPVSVGISSIHEHIFVKRVVNECSLVMIRYPDKDVGQFPMAYVVRKDGSSLSESQVMDFVAGQVSSFTVSLNWICHCSTHSINSTFCFQVAPYKRIRKVAFISSVPKNPSGKILRKDLIKLATSKL